MSNVPKQNILNENYERSGVYPRRQLNDIGRMLNNISGKDGVTVDANRRGITIKGQGANSNKFRFKLTLSKDTSDEPTVKVAFGKWTRNGIALSLATDAGEDFLTIANSNFVQGGNNFIILELDYTEEPTTVTISVETTLPAVDVENTYWVLGNANWAADDTFTITQYWYGGDIEDTYGEGGISADSSVACSLSNSLQDANCVSEETTLNFRQLYDFEDPTLVNSATLEWGKETDEYAIVLRKQGDGSTTATDVCYLEPMDLTVQTNSAWNTTTGVLTKTLRTIKVLSYGEEWTEIVDTAQGCP